MSSASDSSHDEVVKREFARQSSTFAQADSFFGLGELGDWIGAELPLRAQDTVLDVCGGAGHLARHLSSRAKEFVVLDLTPEQLQTGREGAAREGSDNVRFVEGDALAIPFDTGEFDLAMSRFAFHHLIDPAAASREMARVVRPGGHVAVIDMVSGGSRHDELEIVRDPSHTRALPEPELLDTVVSAAGELVALGEREQDIPVEPWLAQASPTDDAAAEVRRALEAEADGGAATGLRGRRADDGSLLITHRWVIAVARRPDGFA